MTWQAGDSGEDAEKAEEDQEKSAEMGGEEREEKGTRSEVRRVHDFQWTGGRSFIA